MRDYQNSALPVERRVADLLARMTLEEKAAQTCMLRHPRYSVMFLLVLFINMIVWLKVSTDIFLVFAIFLCVSKEENDAYEKQYEDSLPDPLDI